MKMRPLTAFDIDTVYEIQNACYLEVVPEDRDILLEKISLFPAGCLAAEIDGTVVGYLLSHPWNSASPPELNRPLGKIPGDADCFYIHDLAVAPGQREHGIGRALFRDAEQVALELGFSRMCLIAVQSSAAYWGRLGFTEYAPEASPDIGARVRAYQADALYMSKVLVSSSGI